MLPTSEHQEDKTKAGILLFIVCCLLSTIRLAFEAPRPGNLKPDDIASRSDQRFAALKPYLPAKGVIGYIGPIRACPSGC